MTDAPVACDLGQLDAVERARQQTTLEAVRAGVRAVEERPDGYAFTFDSDTESLTRLAEFIALESRCCAFLDFRLDVKAGSGAAVLSVTGGAGAKEFVAAELVAAGHKPPSRKLPVLQNE
ncbi:MAG TPA: hypothetical protein VER32_01360 [Pyrinomonadaceae bacterium]|nr:hypothetical protein [Pyrinomonadaceae bacterium]